MRHREVGLLLSFAISTLVSCGRLGFDLAQQQDAVLPEPGGPPQDPIAAGGSSPTSLPPPSNPGAGLDAGAREPSGVNDAGPPPPLMVDAASPIPDAGAEVVPFGPGVMLAVSDLGAEDQDPKMSADGLELFFSSRRPGGRGQGDIWTATRSSTLEAFGAPRAMVEFNTPLGELPGSLSLDGLTLWYWQEAETAADLLVTTRTTKQSAWAAPQRMPHLAPRNAGEAAPCVTADGLMLFYVGAEPWPGLSDIFVAVRESVAAPWGAGQVLAVVSRPNAAEWDPATSDGLTLYFSLYGDLYTAERTSREENFGTPTPLSELNSASIESDPWISADGRTLLFASERDGVRNLYQATR